MFDAFAILTSLAHAGFLIGILMYVSKKWHLPERDWPFFVLLLLWAALVLAGHGAGAVDGLGSLSVYVPMTLAGLGVMVALAHSLWRLKPAAPLLAQPKLQFTTIDNPKAHRFVFWFLCLTLGLFALISLVLAMSVYPDNADSMIYRLPRAVWYVSSGNLLHPFVSPDNRLVYYPLDGTLLYIPLVLYGLPGTFHSIPSLLSWGMVVYATYRFAREFGAQRVIALFAAWLVGLTPSILAQSMSTNDEIIAAAVLLCGLYMGWRWLVTGRHLYFFMAGLALSLSAGTKLHIVFLMPIVLAAALMALWRVRQKPDLLKEWIRSIGWKTALTTFLIMFVMFAPFLFYNYASTGRFYFFDDFKKEVFNMSASFQVGFQNLLIYLSQMILSPIADMNFWPVANDRQQFNTALNQIFSPLIKPFIDENPAYYHLGYRFVGVTLPVSVRFVEFSLWSAFVWLLWPLQARLSLKQKSPLRPLFFLLAITPLFWLVFWSFTTLYMEGTATYFTFYLICAAPVSVMAFGAIRRAAYAELRWVVVAFVAFSNLVICHNLVMYSGFRALPDLYYAKTWPYDWLLTENTIIHEIRRAEQIRIVMTHEKMPYFGYMHWNPTATYYSPFDTIAAKEVKDWDKVLQILPVSGLNMYGFMPFRIPGKTTTGVTYLGTVRAIGREVIFALGAGVEKRYPDQSNYIVLTPKMEPERGTNRWVITFGEKPMGYSPNDQLTFEYEIEEGERRIYHRPAAKDPGFTLVLNDSPHQHQIRMTTIIRSAWSGKELTRETYALGGAGMWLPDIGEY